MELLAIGYWIFRIATIFRFCAAPKRALDVTLKYAYWDYLLNLLNVLRYYFYLCTLYQVSIINECGPYLLILFTPNNKILIALIKHNIEIDVHGIK